MLSMMYFGLGLRRRRELRLPRVLVRRGHEAVAVDRHLRRHEQQVAGLHRLRLVAECGRNAGVDMALLRGAAGLRREHVDLDRAVVGR